MDIWRVLFDLLKMIKLQQISSLHIKTSGICDDENEGLVVKTLNLSPNLEIVSSTSVSL